jgi:hypothetical protein
MGRPYAGILGSLVFGSIVLRGVALGSGVEATVLAASAACFVFAALGYLSGTLAEFLIRDSVRLQFQSAMADWEKQQKLDTPATKT